MASNATITDRRVPKRQEGLKNKYVVVKPIWRIALALLSGKATKKIALALQSLGGAQAAL
jgi:hypothetical protein